MNREDIKNLLMSLTAEDYESDVDLHIHSRFSDGKMSSTRILEEARRCSKRYIAVADHNTIDIYLKTNILADDMVIPAAEFDCYYDNALIHILGYGFDIDNEDIRSLMAETEEGKKHNIYRVFHLRKPQTVIEKIRNAGGVAVLAHPACYWIQNLDEMVATLIEYGLEGIEIYYPYKGLRRICKFHSRKTVIKIADKYNLIKTGGSDTHGYKLS